MSLTAARKLANSVPWLDAVGDRVQPLVKSVLGSTPRLRDALDGTWLGAPLHPALTDVPLGAWTAAVLLDGVDDGAEGIRPADGALAVGVLAAIPTAVTGLSDWSHLRGEARRIGSLHAVLNSAGLTLNVASLALRASDHRAPARVLSLFGFAITALAAHLGGQLSFGLGVRVNRTAWDAGPKEYTAVLDEDLLEGDELHRVDVDGRPVVVARSSGGEICAIAATCSHLGGPLDQGERIGETVVCPWHGSRFDLCTGEVVHAPAVFPQPRFDVRVRGGKIELRTPSN